jgi:hypothetical protein
MNIKDGQLIGNNTQIMNEGYSTTILIKKLELVMGD